MWKWVKKLGLWKTLVKMDEMAIDFAIPCQIWMVNKLMNMDENSKNGWWDSQVIIAKMDENSWIHGKKQHEQSLFGVHGKYPTRRVKKNMETIAHLVRWFTVFEDGDVPRIYRSFMLNHHKRLMHNFLICDCCRFFFQLWQNLWHPKPLRLSGWILSSNSPATRYWGE